MSGGKEKLPKLVDVYRSANPLGRRQLPLIVDENLTLVMDVRGSGIVCDNPLVRGRELDEFTRKWVTLTDKELNSALQITKSELMNVLNQNVPCVGCRRSVERLYDHLFKLGHPTLDPLMVKPDGTITIQEEKQAFPQVLCSIFQDHSARLAKLIENQPKRNKKSLRCLLHSLDSQRSRPLTPVWRDVWDCMRPDCKKDVCIIEAACLFATLETYLRKHRFCGECRTKVLKAYTLLMEHEPEQACKEKGYVSSLYAGIKRCLPDKHIHLQMKTDYITRLISRAEPELLGSRRERHAKTLEIAQEEVLTCLGICMYERLHRIYMRMREEECTCQVFAAVAVDTLSRSFETAVERKQGVSQLELLYAELAREEQQKQMRKQQKKIKRRRRKGKIVDGDITVAKDEEDDDDEEEDEEEEEDEDDKYLLCTCSDRHNSNSTHDSSKTITTLTATQQSHANDRCYGLLYNCCDGGGGGGTNVKKQKQSSKCGSNNNGSSSDHSHDCGYSSENNNGCCETGSLVSSISSSPDGSEFTCLEPCCQLEQETECKGRGKYGQHPSLQEMLDLEGCSDDDDDDSNCKLTPEEVWEFESNHKHLDEQRQELREALKKRFIDFCCTYGPLQMPRLLVQTKYASN